MIELKSEEELINYAIKDVKKRFNMLDAWNVGADTTPETFVKEVAKVVMRKSNEQAVEYSLEMAACDDYLMEVDKTYNSQTGNHDGVMGIDIDAVKGLKEEILNELKLKA